MKNYRYLVTFADGTIAERSFQAESATAALVTLVSNSNLDGEVIASIDRLEKGDDREVAKARKTKKRPSRADRYSNAQADISQAKAEMEELRDELQNWRDNIPENMQDGQKASELDDAISELEDAINDAESAEGHDVNFPGMF